MAAVILAVLCSPQSADRVLAAAHHLASLADAARINVLATRMPPLETILRGEETLTPRQEQRIRAEEHDRVEALRKTFVTWTDALPDRGIVTEWVDLESRGDEAVRDWGRRADLIIIKRPEPRDPQMERQIVQAALFESERPILLVPPEPAPAPFGRRVCLAWRDDKRAVGAALAALRWLKGAEIIHVLAGAREGAAEPQLPDLLEEHGLDARLHVLPIASHVTFGETLLAKVGELGADMLVMGAFARHPAQSLILGGVTRYVLAHANVPVLMRH